MKVFKQLMAAIILIVLSTMMVHEAIPHVHHDIDDKEFLIEINSHSHSSDDENHHHDGKKSEDYSHHGFIILFLKQNINLLNYSGQILKEVRNNDINFTSYLREPATDNEYLNSTLQKIIKSNSNIFNKTLNSSNDYRAPPAFIKS